MTPINNRMLDLELDPLIENTQETWHGQQSMKDVVVERIRSHERHDALVRGVYNQFGIDDKFEGCALGCTLVPFGATEREVERIERYGDSLAYRYMERGFAKDRDLSWPLHVAVTYGFPLWLAVVDEGIFEGYPTWDEAMEWPAKFAAAVPVGLTGADLEPLRERLIAHYEGKGEFQAAEALNEGKFPDGFHTLPNGESAELVLDGLRALDPAGVGA